MQSNFGLDFSQVPEKMIDYDDDGRKSLHMKENDQRKCPAVLKSAKNNCCTSCPDKFCVFLARFVPWSC